ncbi:MAG: ABC transporter ATP-binding protein [Firmicutes bacterium]|nr:ABC transporter ATP-binding protein [Bacillota bacterium]
MAEVRLENVEKSYGQVCAVRNLSLAIRENEFVTLLGPSGCGKSTVLNMIAGLLEPSAGTIYIDGQSVNDIPPHRRGVAMVFQDYALYPHMTVFDNIAFPLRAKKADPKSVKQEVENVANTLGLTELLHRLPKELSGGQRQRVALGRAIVRKPKVFLMDEPLSNLDARLRIHMRAELRRLHRAIGTTTIYVTHDQAEAMTLSDRIVVLKDGIIQQIGTPLDVYRKPANTFVGGFIGAVGMNYISCEVNSSGIVITANNPSLHISLPRHILDALSKRGASKVLLGVRAEDICIASKNDNAIEGVVDVLERMGSDTYIHVILGETRVIARVSSDIDVGEGNAIRLSFDMGKISFYAADTGDLII